jgi:hypothetical protein
VALTDEGRPVGMGRARKAGGVLPPMSRSDLPGIVCEPEKRQTGSGFDTRLFSMRQGERGLLLYELCLDRVSIYGCLYTSTFLPFTICVWVGVKGNKCLLS